MTFKAWLSQSVGDMAPNGSVARESTWFELGCLDIAGDQIEVTDLWQPYVGNGLSVKVEPGMYVGRARGSDFSGHRRVGAMQLVLSPANFQRGEQIGQVDVDSWGVAIADCRTWQQGIDHDVLDRWGDTLIGTYADGCEIVLWTIDGRTAPLLIGFTGLGSGGYPVFALREGDRLVGVECEFIEPGCRIP